MKLNRIMFAAPKSGSGKTMITCAVLETLKEMGLPVVSYKCGPDYIDPMFHQQVLGIPSKNLDTFFTGEKTKELFLRGRRENDFAVLEGVMGLFDGLGGVREEGSSYHLAKVTGTPVILVIDAKGMGRSLIPLIAGFLAYDMEHLIKGVILNRTSESYCETIRPLIERECGVTVLGCFPERKEFQIGSRHLGLMLPEELVHIKEQLKAAAKELQKTVSFDKLIQIAENADTLESCCRKEPDMEVSLGAERPVIAVARDEAFCFYYEDNLALLREYGAEIHFFSPVHDDALPEECDGLLLGGGYPELYGKELGGNVNMLEQVRKAIKEGVPVVAECGGFLYLHARLIDKEKHVYPMAGVIPADCYDTGRLVRFGYIELQEKESCFLEKGTVIKGHEFHYYDSQKNGEDCLAVKPVTGKGYPCVIAGERCFMGFPHLYYPSNPSFAGNFVEKARKYKREKQSLRRQRLLDGGEPQKEKEKSAYGKFISFF